MTAAGRHGLKDILMFVCLIVLVVALGGLMRGMQAYIAGDWSAVSTCRTTYWQCRSQFQGRAVRGNVYKNFKRDAKACTQTDAYQGAVRRAHLDCQLSNKVRRNSCRESETNCALPNSPQYY